MKKLAIIRGWGLNKYEMQTYEFLMSRYEVCAFGSRRLDSSAADVRIPACRLVSSNDLMRFLPGKLRFAGSLALEKLGGVTEGLFGLSKKLKGYDIVHTAESLYYYSYQAAKAKERLGFKLVSTQSENVPFGVESTGTLRRRKYRTLKAVDHFVAISQRAKECLMLEGVEPSRISVLGHGIDTQRFKPRPKDPAVLRALGATERDIIITYVGRMVRVKGVLFLLLAFKRLMSDPGFRTPGSSVKLALFGAGPQLDQLRPLAERLDLQRHVCFCDFYPYNQIENVYNTSDIFVLPSIPVSFPSHLQEQFGMVLVESMASECAVVAAQSGAISEVVGDAGLLCQPADFLDLSEKLRRLCLDPGLRQELGRRARERVSRQYDARSIAQRLADIYEQL
jgi:glycosyltransferase involved in cell wall biosynthesis